MRTVIFALLVASIFCISSLCRDAQAQSTRTPAVSSPLSGKRFTVSDDIEFSYFGDPFNAGSSEPVEFSPDGRYFVVNTQRGRLDLNRPETTLRVFRTDDIKAFLASPEISRELPP